MVALTKFVRNTSPEHRNGVLQAIGIVYPSSWASSMITVSDLQSLVEKIELTKREELNNVSERIKVLSDNDLGQELLLSLVDEKISLKALKSPYDRAAWVYKNNREAFKKAEHFYFHDAYRNTRKCDSYRLRTTKQMDKSKITGPFFDKIKDYFQDSDSFFIEVYERTRDDLATTGKHSVSQIMIYREGVPCTINEVEANQLNSQVVKPARETTLLWNPDTGDLEIVSNKKADRDYIGQCFSSTVMCASGGLECTSSDIYRLNSLRRRPNFPVDWGDGIESVSVTELVLKSDTSEGYITIKSPDRKGHVIDVYDLAEMDNLSSLLGRPGLQVQAAKFCVRHKLPDERHEQSLRFKIALPSHCSLKTTQKIEIDIRYRLLKKWGLVAGCEA